MLRQMCPTSSCPLSQSAIASLPFVQSRLNLAISMAAIHLIERENLFSRVADSQTEFESGYWAISETEARELIGANIYFHERQLEPSFYGGVITGVRVHQAKDLYTGRMVFRFEPKPQCRNVRTGREGWQYEKKIVK